MFDDRFGVWRQPTLQPPKRAVRWNAAQPGGRNMNQDSLTKEQAKIINATATADLGYLHRLRERMVKAEFPPDDPLLKLVENAYDATHRLTFGQQHTGQSSTYSWDDPAERSMGTTISSPQESQM